MAKKKLSAKRATGAKGAPKKPSKYVYFFGGGKADGDRTMRDALRYFG